MSNIKFEKIVDNIVPYLENPEIDFPNRVIVSRCPLCGDSKTKKKVKRFKINYYKEYNTYMYKCFRCGVSNNVIQLLSELSNNNYIKSKNILKNKNFDIKYIKKKLSSNNETKKQNKSNNISYFNDFIKQYCYSIDDKPEGRQDKRLIEKLKKFNEERKPNQKCFICHSGKFKSRIIIPIYDNFGNIIYFQGRSLYDHILPKYLNPKSEKDVIFNFHRFKKDKYIILSEGILDADSVEYGQGTTILGASIKDKLVDKILKKTDKGIILALDNYRYDNQSVKTIENIKNNIKYFNKIKYFIFPKKYKVKDLNQLKVEYENINIYDFVVKNSYPFDIFWIKFKSLKWE